MAYRVRDMTTGLYMNELRDEKDVLKQLSWHSTGHMWGGADEIVQQFADLQEQGVEISPLWEVESITIEIHDRYPAMVHTPPKRKKS